MSERSRTDALSWIAWSRIWSPVVPDALREEAWRALALPDSIAAHDAEFWSTFHLGAPAPRVPLLLHAALKRDGVAVRNDWMRVAHHLGLRWDGVHLPPDQLGAACEAVACAVEREESVLIEELRRRYLLPWCDVAEAALDGGSSRLAFLPARFRVDVLARRAPSSPAPDAQSRFRSVRGRSV